MSGPIFVLNPNLNRNLNPQPEKKIRIRSRIRIKRSSLQAGRRRRSNSWTGMILAVLLTGCAVGPNYKQPAANEPQNFRGDTTGRTNSLGDLPWWQLFQDPTLQALIQTALTNNYDLRVAVARVEESRALLAQSRSQFYPQVTYQGASGFGRNVLGGAPYDLGGPAGKGSDFAGNVSWEIDFWGRIRRLTESSRAEYFATDEARRNVTISLIAGVAQSYFQLLTLDEEMAIAQNATNSFAQSAKLFSDRLRGGVSSKLETSAAEAALASAAATIPELQAKARFTRITSAALRESHVHDVAITRESPNYPSGG